MSAQKFVTVVLTELEHKGLKTLAGEGATGLLEDEQAARGFIGNKRKVDAATNGLQKLFDAKPGPAPIWLSTAERQALREACGALDAGINEMNTRERAAFDSAWRKL